MKKQIAAIGLAVAMLAASCGDGETDTESVSAQGTTATDDVKLMLNWVPNSHHAGIYYAMSQGWYQDAGINLEVIENGDFQSVETLVDQGTVTFGIAQAESLLPARAQGADVAAIATLLPVNDSGFMSLVEDDISDPSDLATKTYGGFGGALENELVSSLIGCAGVEDVEVSAVNVGEADYIAGLKADQFDYVWVFEGWDGLREEFLENTDTQMLRLSENQDCIPNWYTPLILTKAENVSADVTKEFLTVTAKGYEAVTEDPAAGSAALLELVAEMDEDLVTASVAYYAVKYIDGDWGTMDAATWEAFDKFLVDNSITESPATDGAWSNESLPSES